MFLFFIGRWNWRLYFWWAIFTLKKYCKISNFNTFEDFHNHYLKKDISLLAESFEKFVSTSLKCYNLDPCHYLSAPGLSWDAMLKMTKVKVEKISDPDKYLFFEQGMRGGVSYINKRYNEASKMSISFISTWIIYMDMQRINICLLIILNGSKIQIKSKKN